MMAENMITNYSRPAPAINVIVNCGVSYSSDLQQVQDIAITAARELAIESEHAVTNSEPSFGFDTFGDSNIDFWVFIQATDRIGAWYLKSDLIKLIPSTLQRCRHRHQLPHPTLGCRSARG